MTQPNDAGTLQERLLELAGSDIDGTTATPVQLLRASAARIEALEARERVLREAADKAKIALNLHEAWEANLIMSELEINSVPAPTQDIWDQITTHLQPARNEALALLRSLGGEAPKP